VNGTAASGVGTTSSSTTGSFAIGTRTDYIETQTASASGLASSTLVRDQATLNADFTCGTFGSATTLAGAPAQSGLSNGSCYRYTLTGLDNVANTASILTTVKVDTVAPTATNIQLANNDGTVASNDTVVITYSEEMDASSFCPAVWANDGSNQSIAGPNDVSVTVTNSGTNDILTVTAPGVSCTGGFKLGSIALGGDYVSATRTFSGTGSNGRSELSWNASAKTLTIELGSPSSGGVNAGVAAGTPSYTASTALKDRAGNAIGAGPYSGSPASRF
jgi:hypothetical protein